MDTKQLNLAKCHFKKIIRCETITTGHKGQWELFSCQLLSRVSESKSDKIQKGTQCI